jgi:hypothetical protein
MSWKRNHEQTELHLHNGNKTGKHEFGTGFYVNKQIMNHIIGSDSVSERICNIRIKLQF